MSELACGHRQFFVPECPTCAEVIVANALDWILSKRTKMDGAARQDNPEAPMTDGEGCGRKE